MPPASTAPRQGALVCPVSGQQASRADSRLRTILTSRYRSLGPQAALTLEELCSGSGGVWIERSEAQQTLLDARNRGDVRCDDGLWSAWPTLEFGWRQLTEPSEAQQVLSRWLSTAIDTQLSLGYRQHLRELCHYGAVHHRGSEAKTLPLALALAAGSVGRVDEAVAELAEVPAAAALEVLLAHLDTVTCDLDPVDLARTVTAILTRPATHLASA